MPKDNTKVEGSPVEFRKRVRFRDRVEAIRKGSDIAGVIDRTVPEINYQLGLQPTDQRRFVDLRGEVPSRLMSVTEGFDLTGLAYGGFLYGGGVHIASAAGASGYMFDLQGSQLWHLRDFTAFVNPGTFSAAIHMERTGGASAGVHRLDSIGITNYGSVAGIEMDGAETCRLCHVDVTSVSAGGGATPSPALYVHTASGGLLTATFQNCHFTMLEDTTVLGKVVSLLRSAAGDLKDITFLDCTFRAVDGNPLAGLYVDENGGTPQQIRIERCRFECDVCEYGIFFDCSSAGLTIRQCTIIAQIPIYLAGSEHAGLRIAENALYSTNSSELIKVSNTNYDSLIEALYYMDSGGAVDLNITGSAQRTLITGFRNAITGTVATSSSVQERKGAYADWNTVVKSANQDVTNAGVTNDSELTFPVVTGGHYAVELDIILSANNTTGDYTADLAVSAGTMTGKGTCQNLTAAAAVQNIIVTAAAAANTTAIVTGAPSASLDDLVMVKMRFAFTASADATCRYRFGNSAPAAGRTSRTWKGSVLRWKRLD